MISFSTKKLEKQEQIKHRKVGRKNIMIRAEINEL